jgi:MFS family permease
MTEKSRTADLQLELQLGYPGWRVLVAAFFGVMTGYSVLVPYTFSMFFKPLSAAFGWRRDQISLAFGFVAVTVSICAPFLGRLLDRYGPRRTLLPCIAVFGLAFASLALLSGKIWHLYLVFILLGLVGNGTTPLGYSRAVATWFRARRGMALAWVSAGAGVGAMTLPLLAATLLSRYGWRFTYAALGLLVLVVGLPLTLLFVRESNRSLTNSPGARAANMVVSEAIRSRPFLLLILAIFLYSVTFNGVASHLSALLTDRGISLQSSAVALSILGGCGLAGRILLGFVLDKFSVTRVSLLLFVVTVVGVLLLSQSGQRTPFVAIALLGFAAGGESDISPYLLSRYFGLRPFATLYGFAWMAFAAGMAVGPFLMGKLYAVTGSYLAGGIRLFAIPTAISALLMAIMPDYPALEDENRAADQWVVETPA